MTQRPGHKKLDELFGRPQNVELEDNGEGKMARERN